MSKQLMKGNEALAEAALRAGCRFYSGYPITPQNEIPEYLARRLPEVGGAFVQGESEVASINMVYGSAGTGTRAMTSSSSCGIRRASPIWSRRIFRRSSSTSCASAPVSATSRRDRATTGR